MKNTLDGIDNTLGDTEKQISELEKGLEIT